MDPNDDSEHPTIKSVCIVSDKRTNATENITSIGGGKYDSVYNLRDMLDSLFSAVVFKECVLLTISQLSRR